MTDKSTDTDAFKMQGDLPIGSDLAQIEWNPYTIRGIFLLLTRIHYSDSSHFGRLRKKLDRFVWNADKKLRGLLVDYDYNYDPKELDVRPAIFVGTDDINYEQKVSGDSKAMTQDLAAEEFIQIGSTVVVIRHLAGTPDEALQLGTMTFMFFRGLTKMFKDQVRLYGYHVATLKSSRPFESTTQSSSQQFAVDLLIRIRFNAPWLVFTESHRIKDITLETSLAQFG